MGLWQSRGCGRTVRSELEDPNFGATSRRLPGVGTTKGTKKMEEKSLARHSRALPGLNIVWPCVGSLDGQGATFPPASVYSSVTGIPSPRHNGG